MNFDLGKSTVLKQMKLLYSNGFTKTDMAHYKAVIHMNCIEIVRALLLFSETQSDSSQSLLKTKSSCQEKIGAINCDAISQDEWKLVKNCYLLFKEQPWFNAWSATQQFESHNL